MQSLGDRCCVRSGGTHWLRQKYVSKQFPDWRGPSERVRERETEREPLALKPGERKRATVQTGGPCEGLPSSLVKERVRERERER